MRVRLLGRAGVQGAARGGLSRHSGQFQSGHHHDRSGDGRRHLHRAGHLADGGQDHREGTARCAAADHGRPDRSQHRARSCPRRGAGKIRRRTDRRLARGHRQGRGPRVVQEDHGKDRSGVRARRHRPQPGRGPASAGGHRFPGHHPPVVHARRHRRRYCLQQGRVRGHLPAWSRRLADPRAADRGIHHRLEGIRDGGGARPRRQLHHHLLDRKFRPDGRAHRRFHYRRPGADADRQGIPDHARCLHRLPARNRCRHRRIQRAVRHQPAGRAHDHHRDESARVPLLGAGLQGHRLPDRQGGGQAGGRLHTRRAAQRHHRRRHPGLVRTVD